MYNSNKLLVIHDVELFNLNTYDDYCKIFNQIYNEFIYEALVQLRDVVVMPNEISLLKDKIKELNSKIDNAQKSFEHTSKEKE